MIPFYQATFRLGTINKKADLESIIKISKDWISYNKSNLIENRNELEGFESGFSLTKDQGSLTSLRIDDSNNKYFGFLFNHIGQDSEIHWLTTLAAVESDSETQVQISLGNTRKNDRIAPITEPTSRPRIVTELIDKLNAYEPGSIIKSSPILLTPNEIGSTVRLINNYDRTLPIVYASQGLYDSGILINPKTLASYLAGIAHVIIPDTPITSSIFSTKIGRDDSPHNGSIMIYWPKTIKKLFNLIKSRRSIEESRNIEADIFDAIRKWTITREPGINIERVEELVRKRDLGKNNDLQSLAESYMHDYEMASKENKELKLELDRTKRELFVLKTRISSLSSNNQVEEELEQKVYSSMQDASDEASQKYQDRLLIHSRAKDEIAKSNFKDCNKFYDILEWLSTIYYEARNGTKPCKDLGASCLIETGARYTPHQSELTMKGFKDEYYREYNGKKVAFEEHIKVGISRDSEEALRVAFYWDSINKKIVVGYVRLHQKNTKSK